MASTGNYTAATTGSNPGSAVAAAPEAQASEPRATSSAQDQHHDQEDDTQRLQLHYASPATEWSAALPVGNGRLGAMVHGRTATELLQLNEDSVWYGGPQDRTPRDALRNLPLLRRLVREGRHPEAEELVRTAFYASPASMRHYEPLGTCTVEFGHDQEGVSGYRRWLDLSRASCGTAYRWRRVPGGEDPTGDSGSGSGSGGGGDDDEEIEVRREVIASYPDQVLLVRVTASRPIRFVVRLNRLSAVEYETNEYLDSVQASGDRIVLHATPGGRASNRLCIALGAVTEDEGGSVEAVGSCLVVHSAACVLAIGAQTTYREADPESAALGNVAAALRKSWDVLTARHAADYRSLFGRVGLRMWPDASGLPTDYRIAHQRDPGLVALYHSYGRYLLISCSRQGPKALPANLQGIWNPSFAPPWGSKYTININIQMNYWPVSACNLFECATPFVDLLERMAVRGRKTAEVMYGCRGWCSHHNTDIWADTDPQDRWMPATLWPLAGVWVCIDMVKLLQNRYDRALHERLAPILEGCIEFLLDFLIPSECGKYLVTNPSLSPENTFVNEDGKPGILCEGSTMDVSIISMAFRQFLWSADALQADHPLTQQVRDALQRLPPLQTNKDGLIQEWGLKDYGELEPGHRHVSHLYGLFPGDTIRSPELRQAATKVLERRAAHGGGHTGWSRAWLLNFHARLRDAERCGRHMDLLLSHSTLPNLLDNHPPFQIDGNFGGCAGILECLVQSERAEDGRVSITVLPACPEGWSRGHVKDVYVGDGWLVSFSWINGQIHGGVFLTQQQDGDRVATVVLPSRESVTVRGPGEHRIPPFES